MASKPKFDDSGFWDWFLKLIKLLIKDPRKGSKAVLIALYSLGGIGVIYFVFSRCDWSYYNPVMAIIICVAAILIYLLLFVPLVMIWTKFDRRLA
jgi:hypothetical protein